MTEQIIQMKCSWCGKDKGTKIGKTSIPNPVSHGICKDCVKDFLDDAKETNQTKGETK